MRRAFFKGVEALKAVYAEYGWIAASRTCSLGFRVRTRAGSVASTAGTDPGGSMAWGTPFA